MSYESFDDDYLYEDYDDGVDVDYGHIYEKEKPKKEKPDEDESEEDDKKKEEKK